MNMLKSGEQKENVTRNYKVYIHISPSLKYYVGITFRDPERRWRPDGSGYKLNEYFWRAIQKYGWDNFQHEIVASNLTKEEAESFERLLIKELNCKSPNGYNHDNGGSHKGKVSDETRQKISDSHIGILSGETHPMARKVNAYTRDGVYVKTYKMVGEAAKGLGISIGSITQACRGCIKTAGGYQFRYYDECCGTQNITKVCYAIKNTKRVKMVELSTNTEVGVFNSVAEIALLFGLNGASVGTCCRRNIPHKGYMFSYVS